MPSPQARPARKRRGDTPGRILDAAGDLFSRHGYHATSMRHIARRAGVVPAAIYNHFDSKEKLFLQSFLERAPQRALAEALEAAEGDTAEALLRDGLLRMRRAMIGKTDDMRLVFVEVLEFDGKHAPDLGRAFLPRTLAFVERLRQAPGAQRGLSTTLVMRAVLGLFMSYVISEAFLHRLPGLEHDPSALEGLGDILMHGLMNPPSSPPGSP